jgi:hypothetical protein
VFCLGCGAETPLHASTCAVCGRAIAGSVAAAQPAAGAAPLARPSAPAARRVSSPETGLPRDTPGRLLLLTALAMLADLLLPWSDMYGEHLPLARLGPLAVALAALIAVAGAPLVGREYRLNTKVAVLPLVIGAFCVGLGLTYWLFLARENSQALAVAPGSSVDVASGPLISADIGLYLFIVGAGVLAVIGYQLFLAAARASVAVPAAAAAPSVAASAAAPAAPVTVREAVGVPPAPEAVGAPPASVSSGAARPLAPAAQDGQRSSVILPGSAAWHEAPQLRAHMRPAAHLNGWRRPGAPGR